jgi:hypothetical protein
MSDRHGRASPKQVVELVRHTGAGLVETKDHLDWELLTKCAEHMTGPGADALKNACDEIEDRPHTPSLADARTSDGSLGGTMHDAVGSV